MQQFEAVFTRYSSRLGRREQSGPEFYLAEHFAAAVDTATAMARAMNLTGDGWQYEVALVRNRGLRGAWPASSGQWGDNEIVDDDERGRS